MGVDAGPWTSQGAVFSDCFQYRYRLWREWDPRKPVVAFLMLNPSVANAQKLDPTVRRCVGFARDWGYGRLEVINSFAWVDGDPRNLLLSRADARPEDAFEHPDGTRIYSYAHDPVGPENDRTVQAVCELVDRVVVAWSGWVESLGRLPRMLELVEPYREKLVVLAYQKDGTPRHPLYMRKDVDVLPFVHPAWHRVGEKRPYGGHIMGLGSEHPCISCGEPIELGRRSAIDPLCHDQCAVGAIVPIPRRS